MVTCFLYAAVVVCGAAILALEILGTRVLGPFYGVSLYLWSALIGVTLAALSVGYALGGRWADRGPRLGKLSLAIGLAGLWVVLIPWLRTPALAATESLGLRAAVLVTATVLFFPPLMLLGMVSPYTIRLKAERLEVVGRTAGNFFAVSTAASVVAAIVTGFFLIPNLGVNRLIAAIGVVLLATALAGFAVARRPVAASAAALTLLLAIVAGLTATPASRVDPRRGVLAATQSAYGEIRVVEQDGLRYMLIDGGTHTIADPASWRSAFPYVDVLDLAKGLFPAPGRMLVIGLGGGSVAKSFAGDGWTVDAVEIDPVVTRMARQYFGLRPEEARVFHQDGRAFLRRSRERYDLVVLDAFGSSAIPFHLVTTEVFALVKSRLREGGVVAMNIESVGWHDILVHALAATLETRFASVLALPIAEPPDQLGNVVLLAADRALELASEPGIPRDRFGREYNQLHAWENRFEPSRAGAPVLTDDHNPVALWSDRINLVARERLHEYFAQQVDW